MQPVKKYIVPVLTSVRDDYSSRTLFPVDRLVIPISQLVLPKEFTCTLNDILKISELIINGDLKEPIVVNDNNLIVDGKKRYYAFKRLGYKKINVVKNNSASTEANENDFGIISHDN